jgi:hypothetical protein
VSTRTKLLAAVAVLGVLVIFLARGGEPSAQLQALEDDPMASYEPPGGTLVDTDSQDEGTSLGKPVDARVTRMFQLKQSDAGGALDAARGAATDAGWAAGASENPRVLIAVRRLPSGRAELTVTLFEDSLLLPDAVEPPALQISLRHLGA